MQKNKFATLLILSTLFISQKIYCIEYQYDLVICAIFRNEATYMREWLEFHKLVGVQHFYLYNNNSQDNYKEILEPYIKNKIVELVDWNSLYREQGNGTVPSGQIACYKDALQRITGTTKWAAFIDIDEYLFPVIDNNLVHFLKDYESYGGLCVNNLVFGTSKINKIPNNAIRIEYLTLCSNIEANDIHGSLWVKPIVRPERVKDILSPHNFEYIQGFYGVNSDKEIIKNRFKSERAVLDKIRINHYWAGDAEHIIKTKMPRLINKFCKNGEYYNQILYTSKILLQVLNLDQYEDRTIFKYLDKLKQNLRITLCLQN